MNENVCPHDGYHKDAVALELCLRPRLDAVLAEVRVLKAKIAAKDEALLAMTIPSYTGSAHHLDCPYGPTNHGCSSTCEKIRAALFDPCGVSLKKSSPIYVDAHKINGPKESEDDAA